MDSTEFLIDDSEFLTPLYTSVAEVTQKWEEAKHRRDRQGKFTESATITVGDRPITVVKPKRAAADKLVHVDVAAFDANFSKSPSFYVGPGGQGGIGDRYARFGQYVAEHDSIEAAEVSVRPDGVVDFTNGRHRYAWLRDQGVTSLPVAMDQESIQHAKKHGYLSTEPEPQKTSVTLYRGDSKTLSPALSYSDPAALFGAGIYLTDSKRIATDYQSKGKVEGEIYRYGGGPKTTKQQAIEAYIRMQAQYTDAEGKTLQFPERLHGVSGEGSADWNRRVKEDEARIAHATKQWEAMKDTVEVRKLADHTIVIQKKGQTGHLSEYEIPHAWIKKTLDAEAEITEPVAAALADALRRPGSSGVLSRELYHKATTPNEDGFLPSFRDVYREAAAESAFSGFGLTEEEGQLTLRRRLKELGFKGIKYAGGITIGGAGEHTAYVFWDEQGLKKVRKKWDEIQKQEHEYGSTQIEIDPHSSAAATLNTARDAIRDDDLMATGKDVDGNHVTVRYGLENSDVDALRSFIASQSPFEAQLGPIELFAASEHSEGAVPVVVRIISSELRAIEQEIGDHADFKEKSFPDYKPHATLAYVKPGAAPSYANLFVHGSFVVHGITISHASGVKETIPFGMANKWDVVTKRIGSVHHGRRHWDPSKHPHQPKGSSHGGEFMETLHGPRDALDSLLNKEKNVSIQRGDVRAFLEMAGEQHEDPDLTDLQVEGMEIFGGNGLGIDRKKMPQIPREHRDRLLKYMEDHGVTITEEHVDPLTLKPTQDAISARRVAEKLAKYEKGNKAFPPVLISQESRILDGHHHWGMMAAFSLEVPDVTMPVFRIHVKVERALALMHSYMKIHGLKRASLSGEAVKWDESLHPRDVEGQFTDSPERQAFVKAAIQRGEAHKVSEDEFLRYHYTGHVPSNAYERYEAGDLDFIHREKFGTLLNTREVNGQTVELRVEAEPAGYYKRTVPATDVERERLYAEYEQEAKRLGTTPMMAGIDLGHGSEAYKALGEFEKRWRASGEEFVRDEQGNVVYLTPEEIQAQGLPTTIYTVGAFVGDKAIGYAGDEFGASGVYLSRAYQRHGIGLALLKTYLEKSGRLATGRQLGQMTGVGQELVRALHRQLVKEAAVQKADPTTGRYVTPFVSFDKQGDDQLRMIASLNSSRLATWGFTAEAEVLGMARYKLTAVLDGRTSKFCRMIDGKVFEVPEARRKVIEALNVQDPEDLKVVQPWPRQDKASMAAFEKMSSTELTARGLHIPPFHPFCRTICRVVQSSAGKVTTTVPTLPADTQVFQPITMADLKELGVEATQENVDQWNEHIGMTPTELLSKLTGMTPQEVLTKGQGVGSNPIQFDPSGNIGIRARGELKDVAFKLGAILDPFTGIYYLTQADLLTGTPSAEAAFLKQMFSSLIDMGLKSSATSLAVGVAGNAAYYAKLGFLPDELEWDTLRRFSLYEIEGGTLKPVLESLLPEDRLLVEHLLEDGSPSALSALVELPFTYEGRTVGEWVLEEIKGTWSLDLTDDVLVEQAKAYLS